MKFQQVANGTLGNKRKQAPKTKQTKTVKKRKTTTVEKRKMKNPCKCGKATATFNVPGQTKAIWCKDCPKKALNAVDVINKHCECGKSQPTFNLPGETIGKWCKECAPKEAVDVKHPKCKCLKSRPRFNVPGETIPIYCAQCPDKPDNCVNLVDRMCEKCEKSVPTYGVAGTTFAKWCKGCSPKGAVDVRHKRCECGASRPGFGLPGEKARWCIKCPFIDDKAVNVVDACECGKGKATYNLKGKKKPLWCSDCMEDNAVCVYKTKMCEKCKKIHPSFKMPEDKVSRWCLNCKPSDAVSTQKKCVCGTRAEFAIPGSPAEFCAGCRKPGTVDHPTRRCEECKQLAIYGVKTRQRCEEHKTDTDLNLVEQICVSCGLMNVLNATKHCSMCQPGVFQTLRKVKENRIRDFLIAHNIPFTQDKIANGTECGKERPDFVIRLGTHIIIIEVDEDQHKGYPCECEIVRMINITQGFGGLPVMWIRYNPDGFKPGNSTKKSKLSGPDKELHLLDWIKWSESHIPEHLGQVVQLFFDGCAEKQSPSDIVVFPEI